MKFTVNVKTTAKRGTTIIANASAKPARLPGTAHDFVVLEDVIPGLLVDARYAGTDNFTGQVVPGYQSSRLLLTRQSALALSGVQQTLAVAGLACKVFDAYRPQRAVDFFIHWTQLQDRADLKRDYYPELEKTELFKLGYLLRQSSHSRGSTVDLTLVDCISGTELDMGTPFDFFDVRSRPDNLEVTMQQRANRMLLRTVMGEHGFLPLAEEWWHFTLQNEPYPDSAFDFLVT